MITIILVKVIPIQVLVMVSLLYFMEVMFDTGVRRNVTVT